METAAMQVMQNVDLRQGLTMQGSAQRAARGSRFWEVRGGRDRASASGRSGRRHRAAIAAPDLSPLMSQTHNAIAQKSKSS